MISFELEKNLHYSDGWTGVNEWMNECVRVCKVLVYFVGIAELLRTLGEKSPKNISISV